MNFIRARSLPIVSPGALIRWHNFDFQVYRRDRGVAVFAERGKIKRLSVCMLGLFMKRTLVVCALFSLGILSLPHNPLKAMEAAGSGSATPEARSHASSIDSRDSEPTPALRKIDVTTLTFEQFERAFPSKPGVKTAYQDFLILVKFVNAGYTVESFSAKGQAKISQMMTALQPTLHAKKRFESFCKAPGAPFSREIYDRFEPLTFEAIGSYFDNVFIAACTQFALKAEAFVAALP